MLKWEDKTDFFSEESRHWCGRYLLQCEVALDEIEVDVYSSSDLWEVFIQFGKITGVSYEKVLRTGEIGDGKIFIYDVKEVVKIRTGDRGLKALQDD